MSGILEVHAASATVAHDGEASALCAGENMLEARDDFDCKPKKQQRQADITPTNVNAALWSGEKSYKQRVMKRKKSMTKGLPGRDKVPKLRSRNRAALGNSGISPKERGGEEEGNAAVSDAAERSVSWPRAVEENEAQQKLEGKRLETANARAKKANKVHRARSMELTQWMEDEQNDKHSGREGPPPMKHKVAADQQEG